MQGKLKQIFVYADWQGMPSPILMGTLSTTISQGKEIFSFLYDTAWLKSDFAQALDPELMLSTGPQYPKNKNFGVFLDSCPR